MTVRPARGQREQPILYAVRAALLATGRVTLWRNNSGAETVAATNGQPSRFIRYGIGVGSADLVGILKPSGRFFAIETKSPTGRLSAEQTLWAHAVRQSGGFCAMVRSATEALEALKRAEHGASE